ncbi:MAG: hypothetical protein ACRDNZ_02510 [Streptosporangiaceae bacterium]
MPDSDVLIHAQNLTKRLGNFTAVDGSRNLADRLADWLADWRTRWTCIAG